jgi:CRP-like cAMP-binding protein
VVQIVRVDYYGRRSVLNAVESGGIFAEAFVCAGLEFMPVSVVASQKGEALLLDLSFARKGEQEADALRARLLQNLLRDMAQKNLALTQKIRCMSPKTTREKLLEYLLDQAKRHGSATFTIPFDRQALADYLGVERSAMSTELGKLRHEGVLESEGAWFHILTEDNDD